MMLDETPRNNRTRIASFRASPGRCRWSESAVASASLHRPAFSLPLPRTTLVGREREIAASTLVVVGTEDILTPVADAQELAAGIPGARPQVMVRGGHLALAEYPEAFTDALLAFLAT